MRLLIAGLIVLTCACAGRQKGWATFAPQDLPDDGEAFVLIGTNALHLRHVEQVDDHLRARVVRAWRIPPVGVAAIADDTSTTSPEELARRAGWEPLRVVNAQLDVPITAIRSARATVDVEPDPEDGSPNDGDHRLLLAVLGTALDLVFDPASPLWWTR